MILIVTIGLWTLSLVIFFINPKNKLIQIGSILAFVCGISGISEFVKLNINNWHTKYDIPIEKLTFIQDFTCRIPLFIGAYCVLMFGLISLDVYKSNPVKKKYYIYFY